MHYKLSVSSTCLWACSSWSLMLRGIFHLQQYIKSLPLKSQWVETTQTTSDKGASCKINCSTFACKDYNPRQLSSYMISCFYKVG